MQDNIDIKFIHKYFPETLENIRAYREILHWDITDQDKEYLKSCIRCNLQAYNNDIIKLNID